MRAIFLPVLENEKYSEIFFSLQVILLPFPRRGHPRTNTAARMEKLYSTPRGFEKVSYPVPKIFFLLSRSSRRIIEELCGSLSKSPTFAHNCFLGVVLPPPGDAPSLPHQTKRSSSTMKFLSLRLLPQSGSYVSHLPLLGTEACPRCSEIEPPLMSFSFLPPLAGALNLETDGPSPDLLTIFSSCILLSPPRGLEGFIWRRGPGRRSVQCPPLLKVCSRKALKRISSTLPESE